MTRKAKELSPISVSRLIEPGHHGVGGVAGLYLYVTESGARSWVLRVMVGTKRRHIGLGGFPDVPLALAKDKARHCREQIVQGIDPIEEREQARSKLIASQAAVVTFAQAFERFVASHGDAWKSGKHRDQWSSTLKTYAFPQIGNMDVNDVKQAHVLAILEPIWKTKNETASRVRGRIESVLDWAMARQLRSGDNPARWKGHLDKLLPAPGKIQKVQHHRAVPVNDMPAFWAELNKREGISARALEFTILTAARSGETRGATWSEIDLKTRVWSIPGERMKAGQDHQVPLSDAVVALLKGLPKLKDCDFVFPAASGKVLSDMALSAVLRRMDVEAVPHGFRSSFRDWAGEKTNFAREVAEMALAHTLENKVEAAYRRGSALEKRREMMEAWADYLRGPEERLSPMFMVALPGTLGGPRLPPRPKA